MPTQKQINEALRASMPGMPPMLAGDAWIEEYHAITEIAERSDKPEDWEAVAAFEYAGVMADEVPNEFRNEVPWPRGV